MWYKKNIRLYFLLLISGLTPLSAQKNTVNTKSSQSTDKISTGDRIVLTAQQIGEMNVQSVSELLNRLPGIVAGETYVKIQGAYDVRVLLDNRPINDPSSSHGGVKWNMVSVNDIEEMIILKGGGAATIGDGTSGGAIIIKTKRRDNAHGHIELAAGNYKTEDLSFRFAQKIKKISMGTSGSYYYTDGYRVNNDKTKKRAGVHVRYGREKNNVSASLDYASDNRGYPGKPQWPTPLARAESKSINASATGNLKSISGSIFYSKDSKETDNPQKPLLTDYDGWTSGAKTVKTFDLGKLGFATTGIECRYEHAEGFREADGDYDTLEKWVYLENELHFAGWVTKSFSISTEPGPVSITPGIRLNYYSAFPLNFNPELRIRYSPGNFTCNAGFALMHNTPNLSKRYYESSTTSRNPDLMPEKGINTTLGIGYSKNISTITGKMGISANMQGYHNVIRDRITYVTSAVTSTGQYNNLGHVVRRGADFSLRLKIDSLFNFCGFGMNASVGILDARDKDTDLYLTASPKLRAKASAGLKLFGILSVRAAGEYTGKQFTTTDNVMTSEPCFIIDGVTEVCISKITIYCKSDNVFNTAYTYSDGYPGKPREWSCGMRCNF